MPDTRAVTAVSRRAVFAAGGRDYCWAEVIAAAKARGEWTVIPKHETGENASVDRSALARWRRDRRLLSADETLAWLAHWDIQLADAERYVGVRERNPPAGTDGDREAWVGAVCSGGHKELASRLAARLVLAPDPPDPSVELDAVELERLERAFSARTREVCERDVPRLISEHAAEWIRVVTQSLSLTDREVAREVALCVRIDGTPFEEVAALSGAAVVESRAFVDQLDRELRVPVSGAVVGEVIGPLATDRGHLVIQVAAKYADPQDPDVLARARRIAIDRAIARASSGLHWYEHF
jgi:hypothetical protein